MKIFCAAFVTFAATFVAGATFTGGAAFADIPPPPGYQESCTIAKQQKAGEECVSCSAYFRERDLCEKQYAKDGYTSRCKTRGASVWSEVWCRAKPKK